MAHEDARPGSRMGGCYTCRVELPATLVEETRRRLMALERACVLSPPFLVIDFTDGCDALFVRVVDARVEEPAGHPLVAEVVEEFRRLDECRVAVLTALRRHLAGSKIAVREEVQRWQLQFDGNVTTEIQVGSGLTRLADQHGPAEAFLKVVERSWLPKVDLESARALLADSSPIPTAAWRSEAETAPMFGPGILALDCQAMEGAEPLPTEPEKLADKVAPTRLSPGQQLVNRLVERVGRNRFTFDWVGRGEAQLEYADKLDSFRIHPRSKRLAAEIARAGLEATLERLAEEYRRLDMARSRVLALVQDILGAAGYVLDDTDRTWWFGRTHGQAELKTGRALSLTLRRMTPERWVRDWLQSANLLPAVPSEDELFRRVIPNRALIRRKALPKQPPPTGQLLPDLASLDLRWVDRRAEASIQLARRQAELDPGRSRIGDYEDPFSLWAGPFWYRSGDAWATERWWMELARSAWETHRRQLAAVLLRSRGEPPSEASFSAWFREHEAWDGEAFEDELLWQFVHELPWPIDEEELPRYPAVMAPRPAQVRWRAARRVRARIAEGRRPADVSDQEWTWLAEAMRYAVDLDRATARDWLAEEELRYFETATRDWIGRGEFSRGPELKHLCAVAAELGWVWVPDLLAASPAFVREQFAFEHQYAEPGLVALKLSWIRPCELAAKFAARALADLTLEQREARARAVAGSEELIESGRTIVQNWLTRDQLAAGIAWQRWRRADS